MTELITIDHGQYYHYNVNCVCDGHITINKNGFILNSKQLYVYWSF